MDKRFVAQGKENQEEKVIFPDLFFRKMLQTVRNGISWPVNLEMLIGNQTYPIVDKIIKPSYFQGKETHLSVVNLYKENVASVQMEDLLFQLHKIFKITPFKFNLLIEHSDHRIQKVVRDMDTRQLELSVRSQVWWRIVFSNQGYKNKYLFKMQKNIFNCRKKEIKRVVNRKPWMKDLANQETKKVSYRKKSVDNIQSTTREISELEGTVPMSSTSHKTSSFSTSFLPSSSTISTSSFISSSSVLTTVSPLKEVTGEIAPLMTTTQVLLEDLYLSNDELE
ncbi:UNVERIFIED_CONTAM: hypothetical protein RMT77_019395 [Armadillidium vulgare]